MDAWPTRCAKNDDGNGARGQVLLVPKTSVRGYQDFESGVFRRCEQLAVLESRPPKIVRGGDFMPDKVMPKRRRRALVEENPHLRCCGQCALGGVLQNGTCLLERDARKKLDELPDLNTVFEVLE